MQALIFGSIGTLAETSHLQRAAFNDAFAAHGLGWHWDVAAYAALLARSGGQARIARHAQERGESVDAEAVHRTKSDLFQKALARGVALRPGVGEALALAEARGWRLALASGTSPANVDALLAATGLSRARFAVVLDAAAGLPAKPAPDLFLAALAALDLPATDAIAVEDNPEGLRAAHMAGLRCIALPGALHTDAAFDDALCVQTTLDITAFLAEG